MPLKLVQRHGSAYWYIRGSIRGVRVDESTGVSDRGQAEDLLIQRSAQVLERSIHGDAFSRTFAEAALSYMEVGGERAHLEPLIRHFARAKLASIGQHEIELAAKKLKPDASNATLNRQIYTPISAVLHHAARKRWCPKPVLARPKQPEGRMRWVTFDEADALIAAAAPHLRPLVVFLLSTGARLSEALYLNWRDVDLTRCHVVFRDTKNGESRGVPLHPRAVSELANLPWERTGNVFRRPAGKIRQAGRVWLPYEDREGEGGGQVKTAWAGMLKRAKIADFTPHDCRHTWATWHYMANRDLRALMELGGWKSADMVIRYAHVNTDHLAPSIGKVWGKKREVVDPAQPSLLSEQAKRPA
ncbi:MAG: tyrosine-type recombinase/integrase [Caulobacteraceae bacterium]